MGTLSVDKLLKTSQGAAEFTLPATDGAAGTVWQTDGSGQLSVATVGSSGIATDAVTATQIAAGAVGTSEIAALAVGSSEIAANAVTTTEIVDDAVTIAKLAATGTADATTFLRGDNAWAAPVGKLVNFSIATSSTNEQNTSGNTTWTLVGPQITYTAASASNKFLILHNHHMMVEDMTWAMALWEDGTSGTKVYEMGSYTQDSQWIPTLGITNVTLDAPDTSSHTYQFAIYRDGGSDSKIRYSPNAVSTGSQMILIELSP